eukprot:g1617.t1
MDYSSPLYWATHYRGSAADEVEYEWLVGFDALHDLILQECDPNAPGLKDADGKASAAPRVLNVGCGNSRMGESMQDCGFQNVCNIDFCEAVVQRVRHRARMERRCIDTPMPRPPSTASYRTLPTPSKEPIVAKELKQDNNTSAFRRPVSVGARTVRFAMDNNNNNNNNNNNYDDAPALCGFQHRVADATDLEDLFDDEVFDLIIDKSTFDSVACSREASTKKMVAMVQEIWRVLKQGGTFISISHAKPERRMNKLTGGIDGHAPVEWEDMCSRKLPRPDAEYIESRNEEDRFYYAYICKKRLRQDVTIVTMAETPSSTDGEQSEDVSGSRPATAAESSIRPSTADPSSIPEDDEGAEIGEEEDGSGTGDSESDDSDSGSGDSDSGSGDSDSESGDTNTDSEEEATTSSNIS